MHSSRFQGAVVAKSQRLCWFFWHCSHIAILSDLFSLLKLLDIPSTKSLGVQSIGELSRFWSFCILNQRLIAIRFWRIQLMVYLQDSVVLEVALPDALLKYVYERICTNKTCFKTASTTFLTWSCINSSVLDHISQSIYRFRFRNHRRPLPTKAVRLAMAKCWSKLQQWHIDLNCIGYINPDPHFP